MEREEATRQHDRRADALVWLCVVATAAAVLAALFSWRALQTARDVRASVSVPSTAFDDGWQDREEMCRMLGAHLAKDGVDVAALFARNETMSTCEEAATAGARDVRRG